MSLQEYASIIRDPNYVKDIYSLEPVQIQVEWPISGEYSSRGEGCTTKFLNKLKLPSRQERQRLNILCFFYKVTGGMLPAIPHAWSLNKLELSGKLEQNKSNKTVSNKP